jgi:hypothetical protein
MLSFLNDFDANGEEDFLQAHFQSSGARLGIEVTRTRIAIQGQAGTRKRMTITSTG